MITYDVTAKSLHHSIQGYITLPKLHQSRCLLEFKDLLVPKRIRQLALPYTLSFDRDFDGVIKGCHKQHGVNWLHPPLVDVLRSIHKSDLRPCALVCEVIAFCLVGEAKRRGQCACTPLRYGGMACWWAGR